MQTIKNAEERTEKAEGEIAIPGMNAESAASLYEDFRKWAASEGVTKVISKNTFGEHLGNKLAKKRLSAYGDETHYLNVRLKPLPVSSNTGPPGG